MGRGSRKSWGKDKKCVSGCGCLKRCPQTIRYSSLQNVEPSFPPLECRLSLVTHFWFTDCGGTDGCNFCVWGLRHSGISLVLCLSGVLNVCLLVLGEATCRVLRYTGSPWRGPGGKEPLFWPRASEELRLLPITTGMSLEAGPPALAKPSAACSPCQYFWSQVRSHPAQAASKFLTLKTEIINACCVKPLSLEVIRSVAVQLLSERICHPEIVIQLLPGRVKKKNAWMEMPTPTPTYFYFFFPVGFFFCRRPYIYIFIAFFSASYPANHQWLISDDDKFYIFMIKFSVRTEGSFYIKMSFPFSIVSSYRLFVTWVKKHDSACVCVWERKRTSNNHTVAFQTHITYT